MSDKQKSIGIVLAGIGILLFGIAALIHVLKKPSDRSLSPAEAREMMDGFIDEARISEQLHDVVLVDEKVEKK